MKTQTLVTSIAAAILTTSATLAEKVKYRIATKIVQLQNEQSAGQLVSESSLSDGETQMIMRQLSKIDKALIQTLPSIVTDLNESTTIENCPTVVGIRSGETTKGKLQNDMTFTLNAADGEKLRGTLTILENKTSIVLDKGITKKQGDQKTYTFDTNFELGNTLIIRDEKTIYFIYVGKITEKGEPVRS